MAFGAFTASDITTPTSHDHRELHRPARPIRIALDVGTGGGTYRRAHAERRRHRHAGLQPVSRRCAHTIVWGDDSGPTDIVTGTGSGMATPNQPHGVWQPARCRQPERPVRQLHLDDQRHRRRTDGGRVRSLIFGAPGIGGSRRTAVDAGAWPAASRFRRSASTFRPRRGQRRLPCATTSGKRWSRRRSCSGNRSTGEERLTPTRDLLVSPAVFTLPQNGSQLVRVALRGAPADPTRELSYRLILQEVPQPANPDFSGLQVALRLSIPVFVANAGATGPALAWSAAASGDGLVHHRAELRRRARPHPWILGRAGRWTTARRLSQPVAAYILPGQTQQLEPRPGPGGHDIGRRLAPSAVEGHDRRRRIRDRTRHDR